MIWQLVEAERITSVHRVRCFTIYTSSHNQRDTEFEYAASEVRRDNQCIYDHVDTYAARELGDGTVPGFSAKGSTITSWRIPLPARCAPLARL